MQNCYQPSEAGLLPILSLVVAFLAVIVGPFLSWIITGRQIREARETTNKQLFTPIQGMWISDLRDKISEILAISISAHKANLKSNFEEFKKVTNRISEIEFQIILMLDEGNATHVELRESLVDFDLFLKTEWVGDDFMEQKRIIIEKTSKVLQSEIELLREGRY